VSVPGIPRYLGAYYVFNYWIIGSGITTSNTISMGGPQSVTAVYTISVPQLTLAELIIGSVVFVFVVVVLARRKLTGRSADKSSTSS
jgi:hypothetical protein